MTGGPRQSNLETTTISTSFDECSFEPDFEVKLRAIFSRAY
jgi:hypothetical protein